MRLKAVVSSTILVFKILQNYPHNEANQRLFINSALPAVIGKEIRVILPFRVMAICVVK